VDLVPTSKKLFSGTMDLVSGRWGIIHTAEALSFLYIPGMHNEDTSALSDLFPTVRSFTYFYDFGDAWEHSITVGEVGYVDGPPCKVHRRSGNDTT